MEDNGRGRNGVKGFFMWAYNQTDELYHHGVLGQKWGVIRKKLGETRAKAAKIEKRYKNSPNQIGSDVRRMAWRKQSLAKRVGKTAAAVTVAQVFAEAMVSPQRTLAKYQGLLANIGTKAGKIAAAKEAAKIAGLTAGNLLVKDKLAESAMKRYDSSGKKKHGLSLIVG